MGLCCSFLFEANPAAHGCSQTRKCIDSPRALAGERTSPEPKLQMTPRGFERIVLSCYEMSMHDRDRLGQGSFSICRRGINIVTGETVAIKTYKEPSNKAGKRATLKKFKRQVEVLTDLEKPFQPDAAGDLWHDQLARVNPSVLFTRLLAYSKTPTGPGPDPSDDVLYVITELAQQSLKEFLALRREKQRPIPKETVRKMARSILLVVAGLHAKGFVHLDLKPENLMLFNGFLKLIDVDSCVKIGTKVSIPDSTISYSPCYCAPEWARLLLGDTDDSCIDIHPGLDAWSTGLTICELVSLRPILKKDVANFAIRNSDNLENCEPKYQFMNWLATTKKVPVPKNVERHDPEFLQMLINGLLVCSQDRRSSCAQCLSSSYISGITKRDRRSSEFSLENMSISSLRRDKLLALRKLSGQFARKFARFEFRILARAT